MGNLQLSPGTLFANRFEIERAAGSGGMGAVYRAHDRYSGEVVALKLLHGDDGGAEANERFSREALLLSELHHPAIVAYVTHGHAPGGERFLAMEWLDGHDLARKLSGGPLGLTDTLLVIRRTAEALSTAHQRGIVHRDIKPSNLFLPGGELANCKLLDFGIARRLDRSRALTRTGMVVGTPEYMAPEQARGSRDVTPATDVFSLGCVLYECLCGQSPFVAEHVAAVLVQILYEEPAPISSRRPGIPAALATLLVDMLQKDPARRIPDAAALLGRIGQLGAVPEVPLLPTLVGPSMTPAPFPENEHVLFSLVVAVGPRPVSPLDLTLPTSDAQMEVAPRESLLAAVRALGARTEYLADGALVGTVPQLGSAQDQVAMAARVALLIREHWPEATVAVTTGHGALQGRTAVGEVADRALSALQRRAGEHPRAPTEPSSGVLLDELTARLLNPRFTVLSAQDGLFLTGEEKEMDANRPLLGRPTPCVGRDAELSAFEGVLASCIAESEARAMLITGPSGIGKSRLRHEFLRHVEGRREPITVLLGRGEFLESGAPYRILTSAIRRLCGLTGGEPLSTSQERLAARIGQHVLPAEREHVILFLGEMCNVPFPDEGRPSLLAARQDPKLMADCLRRAAFSWLRAECEAAPLLLILDDLQWGDALTVSLFDEALQELHDTPLFLLAFARSEVHDAFPKLWAGHRVQGLSLKPLSKKACERLIQQVLGPEVPALIMARAIEQCGGNALFLEELIRAISEGKSDTQSETIIAMLQARIGRLDSGPRRTLFTAAIFGQTFWCRGSSALLGLPEWAPELQQWLEALVHAELIQAQSGSRLPDEKEYRFRHALVRDAAYSLLRDEDRVLGHRLAGEWLAGIGEHASDLAMAVADHFLRGQEYLRAVSWLLRAAQQALGCNDFNGAVTIADRAIGAGATAENLGNLWAIKTTVAYWDSRYADCQSHAISALLYLRPASAPFFQVLANAVVAAARLNDFEEAYRLTRMALDSTAEAAARVQQVMCLSRCGVPWIVTKRADQAETILARLRSLMEASDLDDPMVRAQYHDFLGIRAGNRGDTATYAIHLEQVVAAFSAAGDIRNELLNRATLAALYSQIGQLEEAELLGRSALIACKTLKVHQALGNARMMFALTLLTTPRQSWSEARELVEQILAEYKTTGHLRRQAFAHALRAKLEYKEGRYQEAATAAALACEMFQDAPVDQCWALSLLAQIRLALADSTGALELARAAVALWHQVGGNPTDNLLPLLMLAEALMALDRQDEARSVIIDAYRCLYLRADAMPRPKWRQNYLSLPDHVRVQELAHSLNIFQLMPELAGFIVGDTKENPV